MPKEVVVLEYDRVTKLTRCPWSKHRHPIISVVNYEPNYGDVKDNNGNHRYAAIRVLIDTSFELPKHMRPYHFNFTEGRLYNYNYEKGFNSDNNYLCFQVTDTMILMAKTLPANIKFDLSDLC